MLQLLGALESKVPFHGLNRSRWMERISKITAPNWRWCFKMGWSVSGCFQWCCRQQRSQALPLLILVRECLVLSLASLGLASLGMSKQACSPARHRLHSQLLGPEVSPGSSVKRMLTCPALSPLPFGVKPWAGDCPAAEPNGFG